LTVERSGAAQTVTVAVGAASEAKGDQGSVQRR